MKKFKLNMWFLALALFANTQAMASAKSCEWKLYVLHGEDLEFMLNLGKTAPKQTFFEIKNMADCQVRNDKTVDGGSTIVTACTFKDTANSMAVTAVGTPFGEASMLMLFNSIIGETTAANIIVTTCNSLTTVPTGLFKHFKVNF